VASPLSRVLKQILAILAVVIYKNIDTSIRSLILNFVTNKVLNKFILFRPFISPLCRKAFKGYIDLIIN
jgi:hypothetical protein